MLQKLVIRNYAIIDYLELVPDAHLNIVTGETGAGKSIILGALSLILGDRADTSVLINKDEKCIVEGHFDVSKNEPFSKALEEEDIDYDSQCIIRREISSNGKSRAFINDTPVTLNVLNRLASQLVDLQQQFGHLALEEDNFQIEVLDAVARLIPLRTEYRQAYNEYLGVHRQLADLQQKQLAAQKEADYKQFLYDELAEAALQADEIEAASMQLKQMNSAERIISVLQGGRYILEEGETPIVNELKKIGQQLLTIADIMPEMGPLQERVMSAQAELKDVAAELEGLESKVSLDQELMFRLQERIDIGYKLLKKHGVLTTNELLDIQTGLQEELRSTANLTETIEQLARQQTAMFGKVCKLAEQLSAQRKKTSPGIVAKINELLVAVGMPNAKFQVEFTKLPPGTLGIDEVQFMLDANKSGRFLPVVKAASGGELSRIMLCIKSVTAKALHLPTLVFDEVDTGISGEAAKKVAVLLRDLSSYHQVICITHQPQVAAKGSRHFYVYKEQGSNNRITTNVRTLKQEERILAIAQMIDGEKPSAAAMQNAKELVAL